MRDSAAHISRLASIVQHPGQFEQFERPEWTTWRPSVASWKRCFEEHQLDPGNKRQAAILSNPEVRREREVMGRNLVTASDEIDNLFLAVRGSGYSVSLANRNGLVTVERSDHDRNCYVPADRPGSMWSEDIGGTNGIGTAIFERRPVAVYHHDHFFPDLVDVACIGLPVFDSDDVILGAINLSTRNPELSEHTHRLVFDVASSAVHRLEERFFHDRFRNSLTFRLSAGTGAAPLLSVDEEHRIVGMSKAARLFLKLQPGAKPSGSLWDHFERKYQVLSDLGEDHCEIALRRIGSGEIVCARAKGRLSSTANRPSAAAGRITASRPRRPVASGPPSLADCAGEDAQMQQSIRLLQRVRAAKLPILLLGETGVGKDTVARAIHAESDRALRPFVAFNCAAVPETMIDSELFGYGAGAFTGAKRDGNTGRLAAADGGTLFLDEIGDMPLALQTRLLRVLESGEVAPLGNGRVQHVDLCIIAATNQELAQRVAAGAFRQDLFYRLAGLVITLVPLRERQDLPRLAARILQSLSGGQGAVLSPAAMDCLRRYAWPGNIRELRHVLQRALAISDGPSIVPDDLLLPAAPAAAAEPPPPTAAELAAGDGIIERAERSAIERTLREVHGDIDRCARCLGISRATLYRKLRLHGIR